MTDEPPIYLDYHANTPVDHRVLETMPPFFSKQFGNAASRTHVFGCRAAEAAALISARSPEKIVFTNGATLSRKGWVESLE